MPTLKASHPTVRSLIDSKSGITPDPRINMSHKHGGRNIAVTLLRSSDHDCLVLFLIEGSDGDGVTRDADYCPATVIPEFAPTRRLGKNRFALTDDDRTFDPKGKGPQAASIFADYCLPWQDQCWINPGRLW